MFFISSTPLLSSLLLTIASIPLQNTAAAVPYAFAFLAFVLLLRLLFASLISTLRRPCQ
jgi:hypothetical protein